VKPSRPAHAPSGGEQGYNLVILTVMITVMSIALAAALPRWSTEIEREREEELIFRGLQYAEAIRIFQTRFGRLPLRLEELLETEPRSIRQLWPNPMREDGRWALIFQGRQNTGRRLDRPGSPAGRPVQPAGQPGQHDQAQAGVVLSGTGDDGSEVATGPIRGVYTPGDDETVKTWFDSNTLSEWKFTVDLLQGGGRGANPRTQPTGRPATRPVQQAGGLPGQAQMPVNAGQLGRPFPPGVRPQTMRPGGAAPGNVPGRPIGTAPGARGGPGGAAIQGLENNNRRPGNQGPGTNPVGGGASRGEGRNLGGRN